MLRLLSISNFVIVDQMEIEFSPGFTVLTGETGAGKSIMIDALSLTLGERGDSSQIRQGCERAEISALFDTEALPEFCEWLTQQDLQGDPDSCILRRILDASGRSRALINGHTVTLQQLRAAGDYLVAIHSQHAHQTLLQKSAQRDLLDAFAGCTELAHTVKTAYQDWQNLQHKRIDSEQRLSASLEKREQLEWQKHELMELNFTDNEWGTVQTDHNRLSNLAGLLEATENGIELLSENDAAVVSQINAVKNQLHNMVEYDSQLQTVVDLLDSAQIQVQEGIYELRHYRQRLDIDPHYLQEIERRITAIHGIARKYRVAPEALPNLLEDVCVQLASLESGGNLAQLTEQAQAAQAAYRNLAEKLSTKRRKAGTTMAKAVTKTMQTIAMAGGKFSVMFEPLAQGNANGLEQVEFQVAAHKGLALKPLSKAASGGELSRISLAIQVVTCRTGTVPTLIFDEVDAGIGGRVAEIVGQLLKQLGDARQVMCITHLPQVAAAGDQHMQVSKSENRGSQQIQSRIAMLDGDERVNEIARMLGGVKMTEATREHAAEMLQNSAAG
ncbi:DNA repair protein RecN (Recombination protein N) [Nitrosomonas sp. Nm51]|uniref:DNA repair protein RecN n=1 Tax=Nitrosomonas sp. Nm51 TaxID=133720 RepID=UPI0008D46AC3|nr:DNA repair protein RecN [Nitrosomonas sp. Nm51]SER49688.1 DNA repair protein RecN (Recombination protein N) [Nitrosomonas sp. Nm51]